MLELHSQEKLVPRLPFFQVGRHLEAQRMKALSHYNQRAVRVLLFLLVEVLELFSREKLHKKFWAIHLLETEDVAA